MFTFNQKTPNSSVVQPLHFAGENAEFRPVLPSERPRRTLEMVVIASSLGGEANPFWSPDLLAATHIHGHCGILASRAGPFWVANHRHPPPWSELQGRGAHRAGFSGARPSLCGGGARGAGYG